MICYGLRNQNGEIVEHNVYLGTGKTFFSVGHTSVGHNAKVGALCLLVIIDYLVILSIFFMEYNKMASPNLADNKKNKF